MRKNIFLRSLLRQPLRTGLLMALIALAAFAFFMRTVEYITVRGQLTEMGLTFRTIGFIRGDTTWQDVSAAADILENSPYVAFVDRRMSVEGVLMGRDVLAPGGRMYSPDLMAPGRFPPLDNVLLEAMGFDMLSSNFGLLHNRREPQARVNQTIFTAHVDTITPMLEQGYVILEVHLVERLAGFPEYTDRGLVIGRPTFTLLLPADEDALAQFMQARPEGAILFRTEMIPAFGWRLGGYSLAPRAGQNDPMRVVPLLSAEQVDGTPVWVAPAGQAAYYAAGPLAEDIAFLSHNNRGINLQPTRDMSAMPMMQKFAEFHMWYGGITGGAGNIGRRGIVGRQHFMYNLQLDGRGDPVGRLLNHEDYLHANPVAVINTGFSHRRNLRLGDTFVISIPHEQQIVDILPRYHDLLVRGTPEAVPATVLELEVVGIVSEEFRSHPGHRSTFGWSYVYIPASLLPVEMVVLPPGEGVVPGWDGDGSELYWLWFSFVLNDTRQEHEFLQAYGPLLEELGMRMSVFTSGSVEFWEAVAPLRLIVTFNAVVFWVVLVLISTLVAFMFLQQRRREMAIRRVLGASAGAVLVRLLTAILVIAVPAVLAGGALGWHMALDAVTYTMAGFDGFVPGFEMNLVPNYLYFALLAGVAVLVLLLVTAAGAGLFMRVSVLAQLQGGRRMKAVKYPASLGSSEAPAPVPVRLALPTGSFPPARLGKLRYSLRFIGRQLFRARGKTIMVFTVAALLVVSLGWMRESVTRAAAHIEYLYDNTLVWGEIIQMDPTHRVPDREMNDVFYLWAANAIRDSEYFENLHIEAGHPRAFIISPDTQGNFPENWREHIGYEPRQPLHVNNHTFDRLYGFNDINLFIDTHYLEGIGGMTIDFAPGFGPDDFIFREGESIPVILSEYTLARRGLTLGEYAWVGYTRASPLFWQEVPVYIIGVHNGALANETAARAVFMPLNAMEILIGAHLKYSHISFNVAMYYNRHMRDVRAFLQEQIRSGMGLVGVSFYLTDYDLHNVVNVARQTHLLLTLIYPIILIASLLIAGGVALVQLLQTARVAAFLHVLGASKLKTAALLLTEGLSVWLAGGLLAVGGLALARVHFDLSLGTALGMHTGAVVGGALVGVIIIIRRSVLEMLQLKE